MSICRVPSVILTKLFYSLDMITIYFKTKLLFKINFDFSESSAEYMKWYWYAQEQMKLKLV